MLGTLFSSLYQCCIFDKNLVSKHGTCFVKISTCLGANNIVVREVGDIKGLLTERDVCTVKYRTEVFLVRTDVLSERGAY